MGRKSSSRPEGPMRSRRRRSPPAGSVCWMLTLTFPASRRDTAAADLARRAGLSRVQSRVWPGPARESGRRGCVRQQRRGLRSLRPVAFVLPCNRCVGFGCFGQPKGCWERTQVGEFGVHHSILRKPNIAIMRSLWLCEFRSDRLDRLRDFGRDRRVFPPTNFGARPIWSGRTSFR